MLSQTGRVHQGLSFTRVRDSFWTSTTVNHESLDYGLLWNMSTKTDATRKWMQWAFKLQCYYFVLTENSKPTSGYVQIKLLQNIFSIKYFVISVSWHESELKEILKL